MSLQLSAHKPRQLQYCEGGLRSDLKLMEVDEKLLQSILNQEAMVIKGEGTDDAVLCTSSKTYALKLVETTNTLLLLPPTREELDGGFAATPSLTPPAAGDAGARARDVGLQTQLQKNAAAQGFPPLTATATATSHIELVEIAPNLDQLPKLLGERPYSLEDEDDAAAAADDDDAMDVDGAAGTSSRRPPGCFTTQELLQKVQASEAELLAELSRLKALLLGGLWRRVDESYLGGLLEMLMACAQEHGWSMQAIPLQDAVAALQPEGYQPELVQHCLRVFGRPVQPPGAAAAGPGSLQQDEVATAAGSSGQGPSSSSSRYALDEQEVCLQYARKLLTRRVEWQAEEFLAAWRAAVPDCWQPHQEMLLGEALLLQPDAGEGYSEPRLRHFPARLLPSAPGPRFAALFAVQPRWTRQQLDPYLTGLRVPGQTVEQLLLKFARACQRSPTDSTLVFVAR